jgi:branched-chain amino acid transport system substrate-binding protein
LHSGTNEWDNVDEIEIWDCAPRIDLPHTFADDREARWQSRSSSQGSVIEVIDADHQNKADLASAIARGWFDRQGVTAIADLTNSAVALAVQQLARERGKITLLTGPATTKLTNEECSPTGFHWVFDTYSQATGTAKAMLAEGGKTWFLLVADYAFGHQLAHDLRDVVTAGGGQVVGEVLHPLSTPDFASFLLQAQTSKAQVIGLANGGDDTVNAIKQAAEFGITRGGQKLAGLVIVISIVHGLGLETASGLVFTESFYWDMNEATRAWSKRFFARAGRMPGMVQAGTYSSVMHYLKSTQAAGPPRVPRLRRRCTPCRWTTSLPRAGCVRTAACSTISSCRR